MVSPLDHLISVSAYSRGCHPVLASDHHSHDVPIQAITQCKALTELQLVTPHWRFSVLGLCLSSRHMKHLYIRTQDRLSITDEDFRKLCIEMPNLEFLGLIPMSISCTDPLPELTLGAIRSIADTCPHLRHAVLYVDTELSSLQCYFDDDPFSPNHPLLSLCFPPTPVCDCIDVAAYLCTLFPDPGRTPSIRALSSTEKLSYWEPFSDCNSDDWMQIAGMMDTLRKRVISPLKNTVRSEGCRISKVHKEVRHALAGSVSGEGFDY